MRRQPRPVIGEAEDIGEAQRHQFIVCRSSAGPAVERAAALVVLAAGAGAATGLAPAKEMRSLGAVEVAADGQALRRGGDRRGLKVGHVGSFKHGVEARRASGASTGFSYPASTHASPFPRLKRPGFDPSVPGP